MKKRRLFLIAILGIALVWVAMALAAPAQAATACPNSGGCSSFAGYFLFDLQLKLPQSLDLGSLAASPCGAVPMAFLVPMIGLTVLVSRRKS